jgi:hypothetical protein
MLTGTDDRFCADFDYGSFRDAMRPDRDVFWIRLRHDGDRTLLFFACPSPTSRSRSSRRSTAPWSTAADR